MNAPAVHEVTVDYNEDERDPAWRAVCESGYWAGTWQHAEDYAEECGYLPGVDPIEMAAESPSWQTARDTAERAAEQDARDHQDTHAND